MTQEKTLASLVERMRAQQPEIVAAILARVRTVSESEGIEDAEYQTALRLTVVAVVAYSLTCIERGEEWSEPIPSAAITQAHRAARNGVSLPTIVLRYYAGHRVLGKLILDQADHSGLASHGPVLRYLRETQEAALERLTAAIANEYNRELERVARSAEQRRRELVQRLLVGDTADAHELDYDFDAWHLGVIATGVSTEKAVRGLANHLRCQLLPISSGEGIMWAWLGGQRKLAVADIEPLLPADGAAGLSLATGEPGKGIGGWRLTHQQAQESLRILLRGGPQPLVRFADIMLLSALLANETVCQSFRATYLVPLAKDKGAAADLLATLRAYFKAERNVATAAVSLDCHRHTVERHLARVEAKLNRMLTTCYAELEVAVRLDELDRATSGDNS